jgi:hypothetical protein
LVAIPSDGRIEKRTAAGLRVAMQSYEKRRMAVEADM